MRSWLSWAAVGFAAAVQAADVPSEKWQTYYASTDVPALFFKAKRMGPFAHLQRGVKQAKDGTLEAHGLSLTPPHLMEGGAGGPTAVRYPPLREGDLIPGFNAQVCRVGRLEVPKRGEPAVFTFDTVPKPPPGTALQPGGWAVSIKQGDFDYGTLRYNDRDGEWKMWVDAVTVPDKGLPAADLTVELGTGTPHRQATVRTGDVLRYAGHALRVVNVVPKDPKTRVIGWVEFDPKALPTEDEAKAAAAKSGGKVVVPAPPKK